MNKSILLFIGIIISNFSLYGQVPSLTWGKAFGGVDGSNYSRTTRHELDGAGNIYNIGIFRGTVDFNSGTAVSSVTAVGDFDVFVQKLDNNGNFLWVKTFGNINEERPIDVAVNSNGDVYFTMKFQGSIDVNPGAGTQTITASGIDTDIRDLVVIKLSSNGDYQGHVQKTNCTYNFVNAELEFNNANELFLIYNSEVQVILIQNLNVNDLSVLAEKEIANNSGSGQALINNVSFDNADNMLLAGVFSQSLSMNPDQPGTTISSVVNTFDSFVIKLNSSETYVFGQSFGTASNFDEAISITSDNEGNVLVLGRFENSPDFNAGAGTATLTSLGSTDVFVQKLSPTGSFIWVKQFGSSLGEDAGTIRCDAFGNVISTFYVSDDFDANPNAGTNTITLSMLSSVIVILDENGNYVFADDISWADGTNQEAHLLVDDSNNIYLAGAFSGASFDADPSASVVNIGSSTNRSSYNLKWGQCDAVTPTLSISASTTEVCESTLISFTTNFTNGGTSPIFTWNVNGNVVATGVVSYNTNTLVAGDIVTCIMQSNAECASPSSITSNAIVMTCSSSGGGDELFFSEYLEGSGNNKAFEIYNPTSSAVDLSIYSIALYTNGATTASSTLNLTGTLNPQDVLVVANNQGVAELLSLADITTGGVCSFNGDDALALLRNGESIDIIGQVGIDPGTNWAVSDGGFTSEYTLVRKPEVTGPTTDWSIGQTQWNSFAQNTFTNLGFHTVSVSVDYEVVITADDVNICEGDFVSFNATVTPGNGEVFSYSWYVDGQVLQVAETPTFLTSLLSDGSVVYCTISDVQGMMVGQSNEIVISVQAYPVPTITVEQNSMTAQPSGMNYQWIDCTTGQDIMGETNSVFSPAQTGSYAVEINTEGCMAVSDCEDIIIVSVEPNERSVENVFPNPFSNFIVLEKASAINIRYTLMDLCGKVIIQESTNASRAVIETSNLDRGVYFLRIGENTRTLVKE